MTSYAPDESSSEILLERTFLAGDFICGTGYGVQIVLFILCVSHLWKNRKTGIRNLYLLAYITLLFMVETIFGAVQARTVQMIYIDNRNYPGGPWAYFLATQYLAVNVMFYATLFILTFLADVLVLWRCWVIWKAINGRMNAYLVSAVPALMITASFVLGVLWTLESSQPGLSLYSKVPIAFGTSFYAISLGVNIMLTALITIPLILHRRRILSVLPSAHAEKYLSIATIVIESAAIYSFWSILFLVTYAINSPINQIFLGFTAVMQQIAAYLIIFRLANGSAWRTDVLSTSLQTTVPVQFTEKSLARQRPIRQTDTCTTRLSPVTSILGSSELKGQQAV